MEVVRLSEGQSARPLLVVASGKDQSRGITIEDRVEDGFSKKKLVLRKPGITGEKTVEEIMHNQVRPICVEKQQLSEPILRDKSPNEDYAAQYPTPVAGSFETSIFGGSPRPEGPCNIGPASSLGLVNVPVVQGKVRTVAPILTFTSNVKSASVTSNIKLGKQASMWKRKKRAGQGMNAGSPAISSRRKYDGINVEGFGSGKKGRVTVEDTQTSNVEAEVQPRLAP